MAQEELEASKRRRLEGPDVDGFGTRFAAGGCNAAPVGGPGALACASAPAMPDGGQQEEGVAEVRAFLTKLGLSAYLPAFVDRGFDMIEAVRAMDLSDMQEECGMTLEHAAVLQRELARSGEGEPAVTMTASAQAASALALAPCSAALGQTPAALGCLMQPTALPVSCLSLQLPGGLVAGAGGAAASSPASGGQTPAFLGCLALPTALPMSGLSLQHPSGLVVGAGCAAASSSAAGAVQSLSQGLQGLGDSALALHALLAQATALIPDSTEELPAPLQALAAGSGGASQAVSSQADPALQAALISQSAAASGGGADAYNQCYALAQLAEESAQMNASAAAFCASPTSGPFQIAAVAESAQQAAQRASWAATTLVEVEIQQAQKGDVGWIVTMKQVARQAADAADQAAQNCKVHAAGVRESCLDAFRSRKSRVPCKNFLAGRCAKGVACDFSHDPADMQARPLMLKSMKQCIFFAKGNCMRGPACPFSHGEDESKEIEKYVDILRKEKKAGGGGFRR